MISAIPLLLLLLPAALSLPPPCGPFHGPFVPSLAHDYSVRWSVEGPNVYFEVTAATTGWIGLGVAEGGGMKGSDLAVAHVDDADGSVHVKDMYAKSLGFPSLDEPAADCGEGLVPADGGQHLTAFSGSQTATHTTVVFGRPLDTGDRMDHAIVPGDPTRMILAFSDANSDSLGYHGTNRYAFRLNVFEESGDYDPLADLKADPNVKYFDFLNQNQAISSGRTTYSDKYLNLEFQEKTQIVGFEHIIDDMHDVYVHHFVLTAHKDADDNEGSTIWPWASGVLAFRFPDEAGLTVGVGSEVSGLNMNTHYDNPERIAGATDNSGIRIYYVEMEHARPHEVGILRVGDPKVLMNSIDNRIPAGRSKFTFGCPESCTAAHWEEEVTIVSVQLHMHAIGDAILLEQTRGGEVVETYATEFYDYGFQDIVPAYQAAGKKIKPGDGFSLECAYQTDSTEYFGPASDDEMCISFVMYYPKLSDIDMCGITEQYFVSGGRKLATEEQEAALAGAAAALAAAGGIREEFLDWATPALPAASPRAPPGADSRACVDDNELLSAETDGYMLDCSAGRYFCVDEAMVLSFMEAEAGWWASTCCATCASVPEGADACDYEDDIVSLATGNAVGTCESYGFMCGNDAAAVALGAPPGWFDSVCCRTCAGVALSDAAEAASACLGDYVKETGLEEEAIQFRVFGKAREPEEAAGCVEPTEELGAEAEGGCGEEGEKGGGEEGEEGEEGEDGAADEYATDLGEGILRGGAGERAVVSSFGVALTGAALVWMA